MDTLYKKNEHSRDKLVGFEEKTHIYTIDNKKGFTSVTSLVHMCFPKFNADKVIDGMMKSWKWPKGWMRKRKGWLRKCRKSGGGGGQGQNVQPKR